MKMLKGTEYKILAAIMLLLCALPSKAQNEAYNSFSPYTMYGIGDISKQGSAYNKSMGGVGIASRDKRNINILNPASVTERDEQSFMADFGIAQGNRYYKQGEKKSANNTFNIYDFVISFPIYKSMAMYAGFTPYSDIGYSVKSYETDPALIAAAGNIAYSAAGNGGLTNIFVGTGIDLFKGFTLGLEYQHIFGYLKKEGAQLFENDTFRDIHSGYKMNLTGNTVKAGFQYELPLGKEVSAIFGATYRLAAGMRGTIHDYEYGLIASVADTTRTIVTKLSKKNNIAKFASEIGVGFSLKGGDKWTAEIDYINSDWSSTGIDKVSGMANVGNKAFSATAAQSVRAGFSIVPNRNDIRYYRKRITYRGGAYWDQAYSRVDGNAVNAYGLTFGVNLPVFKWSNGISLGMDVGQRGYAADNMLRERYVNFNIGLNIFDIWFIKPKYE
ncbi:MAG: hypothetical protein HUJ98_00160 [Bacteroidaceae bacterium]|nr:hypothetical protein [Bacteroidaceae bacterium]